MTYKIDLKNEWNKLGTEVLRLILNFALVLNCTTSQKKIKSPNKTVARNN